MSRVYTRQDVSDGICCSNQYGGVRERISINGDAGLNSLVYLNFNYAV